MRRKAFSIFSVFSLLLMLFSSCSDENMHSVNHMDAIGFTCGVQSRGTVITYNDLNDIYVSAKIDNQFYFKNQLFTKNDGFFTSSNSYLWPGDGRTVNFSAFSPSIDDLHASINDGNTKIESYELSENITEHKDFIFATASGSKADNAVQLEFSHTLSAIQINAKNTNSNYKITIKSVRLSNVNSKASFDLTTGKWDTATELIAIKDERDPVEVNESEASIMTTGQYFMVFPQKLTKWDPAANKENADKAMTLDVLAKIENKEGLPIYPKVKNSYDWVSIPVTAEWEKGNKYVYKLDFSTGVGYVSPNRDLVDNVFTAGDRILDGEITYNFIVEPWATQELPIGKVTLDVEPSKTKFAYNEGKATITVNSIRKDGTKITNNPFSVKFSEDNGSSWKETNPDWINNITKTDNEYNFTLSKLVNIASKYNTKLKNAENRGTRTNPFNLAAENGNGSISNDNETTANCYVVNSPGYYKIPIVYGNAKKNGNENPEAYNLGNWCRDYKGQLITRPDIPSPISADLTWQDTSNLINDVQISTDKKYIEFEITSDNIEQGNALISVKDADGTIMWSWHIWVTPLMDKSVAVKSQDNKTYYFAQVNLGEVVPEEYEERKCLIKFQTGNKSKTIEIMQYGGRTQVANCLYYTNGSMMPVIGYTNSITKPVYNFNYRKKVYDISGNMIQNTFKIINNSSTEETYLGNIIKNPLKRITNNQFGFFDSKMWNINNDEIKTTKTITDPSPVGYCVPPINAFFGFLVSGKWTNSLDRVKVKDKSEYNTSGIMQLKTDDSDTPYLQFAITSKFQPEIYDISSPFQESLFQSSNYDKYNQGYHWNKVFGIRLTNSVNDPQVGYTSLYVSSSCPIRSIKED